MKILVVDDDIGIRSTLEIYLKKNGHYVEVAADGKKGLGLIMNNAYDIAFLDEDMPELTGLEIVEYIKQSDIQVKIVILTGYEAVDEKFCKKLGADEYLQKPVNLDQIGIIVRKFQAKS